MSMDNLSSVSIQTSAEPIPSVPAWFGVSKHVRSRSLPRTSRAGKEQTQLDFVHFWEERTARNLCCQIEAKQSTI